MVAGLGAFRHAEGKVGGLDVSGDPASDDLQIDVVTLTKAFAGPTIAGTTSTLTFNIQNESGSSLTSLSFSDDLDAVLSGLEAIAPLPIAPCGSESVLEGTSFLSLTADREPPGWRRSPLRMNLFMVFLSVLYCFFVMPSVAEKCIWRMALAKA